MTTFNRRDFLKCLGTVFGFALAAPNVAARDLRGFSKVADKFDMLVVGDSLIWGQGLLEKDKFYTLTADWLRTEAFGAPRVVDLKVKAHSGSTLKFHPEEAEKYKRVGRDEAYFYKPELNIDFPSTWKQIEVAADEYRAAGNSNGVDLVMMTGGITDITVAKVLDPKGDDALLITQTEKYCRDDMFDVLEHVAANNPNALIVVAGYFPMLSPKTNSGKLLNSWLESMSFPLIFKPFANNPLTRNLFFKGTRKRAIQRSRLWLEHSNKNLRLAVERFNAKSGRSRAVFIESPITEDGSLETPNTLLFRMGKRGRPEDPMFASRQADCRAALPELKKSTGIEFPVRYCEIAGVGHPNAAGAKAYVESIKSTLGPILRQTAYFQSSPQIAIL